MRRDRVGQHLATLTEIFDRAKHTIKTPFSFATDISENARPMTIDGSLEVMERGYHREAMFWIAVTHSRCQEVMLRDAPAGMTQTFRDNYRELVNDLRVPSAKEVRGRCAEVELILPSVWQLAEAIIAANHEIEVIEAELASKPDRGLPQRGIKWNVTSTGNPEAEDTLQRQRGLVLP